MRPRHLRAAVRIPPSWPTATTGRGATSAHSVGTDAPATILVAAATPRVMFDSSRSVRSASRSSRTAAAVRPARSSPSAQRSRPSRCVARTWSSGSTAGGGPSPRKDAAHWRSVVVTTATRRSCSPASPWVAAGRSARNRSKDWSSWRSTTNDRRLAVGPNADAVASAFAASSRSRAGRGAPGPAARAAARRSQASAATSVTSASSRRGNSTNAATRLTPPARPQPARRGPTSRNGAGTDAGSTKASRSGVRSFVTAGPSTPAKQMAKPTTTVVSAATTTYSDTAVPIRMRTSPTTVVAR